MSFFNPPLRPRRWVLFLAEKKRRGNMSRKPFLVSFLFAFLWSFFPVFLGGSPAALAQQVLPTGVNRIDADLNPLFHTTVNADVAVFATGIEVGNADLNVFKRADCTPDS